MTPTPHPHRSTATDPRRKADPALSRLADLLARNGRPQTDPKALAALLAGIAATPEDPDQVWMDLVTAQPRSPELVIALKAARAALAPPPLQTDTTTTARRLKAVRTAIDDLGLNGLMLPRADAHQGEFVAANAERLAWLTGFTGSAGVAVVLAERAALFVDGRYTLQAAEQVDTGLWDIVPIGQTPVRDWLTRTLRRGDKLGFDPWLHPIAEIDRRTAACDRAGARLVPLGMNPIDSLWRDRPPAPLGPVVPHPECFAGRGHAEKRREIAERLRQDRVAAMVVTDPASLAWLLNIRGHDVPFSPLALGFAVLHETAHVDLFMDSRKLTPAVQEHLGGEVRIHPAGAFGTTLDTVAARGRRVLLSRDGCAHWIRARLVEAGARVRLDQDPIALPKARKNAAELAGTRAAHRRDGAALTRFLYWLEQEAPGGALTELSAAAHLRALRAEGEHFRGPSFETISGAGPNGAIVHYRATPATDRRLTPDMLYLVDSGAQYRDGTTDVTRTVPIGTPTPEHIRRFTQVLKGHIAIARAVFPPGTTGTHLDVLARLALWREGVDFEHGTGHGVGSHLGVHEGPQRISKHPSEVALEAGMILSNEPGYYKAGQFGIRIENLVVVVPVEPPPGADLPLLGFETLTLAPIDRRLINADLLTHDERGWLDAYHARVRDEIGPRVEAGTRAWLEQATRPLA